ncbi:uncharacterized protein APUU_22084A [Aspergillus puulaauensis]|uniref:Ankyrin repeat-containing domain protein n=1 Tax=Aspergillus puulaauensis TaxID=1220207 RepID=A0A7R7XHI9_9EURO|nr:uncharacterized protein APUU_22084A [Aspergillus puulaauensis]BCS21652.1 hypothetical protein APUU_22084A [Aspergillus puulaauensis]
MVLHLIWKHLINEREDENNKERQNYTDSLYCILDFLDDDDLLVLMEAFPTMAGLVYWSYGAKYLWKDAIQPRRDEAQTIYWHQLHEALRRQKKGHEKAIMLRRQARGVEAWSKVPEWRHTERVINRRLLAAKIFELERQLECVEDLQTLHARALRPVPGESAARWWNRRFAAQIQADIKTAIAAAKEEDDDEAAEINPNNPPPPPQLASFVDNAVPVPDETVEENCKEVKFKPIERMIALDYHLALRALRRLGLFDPHGYTHDGATYLAEAIICQGQSCIMLIMSGYAAVEIRKLPSVPDVSPSQFGIRSHISLLITEKVSHGLGLALDILLEDNPQLNAHTLLLPNQKRRICCFATGRLAELLASTGLDLAQTTWLTRNSTPWHMAAHNPNKSFYDFLHQHIPDTIDQINDEGELPITIAQEIHEMERVQWLIDRGAAFYPAAQRMLSKLCSPADPWFLFYFQAVGAGLSNDPWINDVVEGLQTQISEQGPGEKGELIERAKTLITKLRAGNGIAEASLGTVNDRNETALQAATRYGLKQILRLLQPPASSRYNLRKRVKRDHHK